MSPRRRLAWFAVVVLVAVTYVAGSLWRARQTLRDTSTGAPASANASAPPARPMLDAAPAMPFIALRHLVSGAAWGRVALAPLAAPDGPRFLTTLTCDRVYMAGGRGICLQAEGLTGRAVVFDDRFQPLQSLPLSGPPSRARVSRDGRLAAFTVFEQGHSYADETFSTRTTILDLDAGTSVPTLEAFTAWRDGRRVTSLDVNYWGVTFVPGTRRFYVTMAYGGTPYLAAGDLDRREVRALAANVECPSLSPDGTRVAFKRANGLRWRLWVRTLATGDEHIVEGETRSVDDQVEWLDNGHLLYQFPSDAGNIVWVADVEGAAPARPFASDAWSPAVVR